MIAGRGSALFSIALGAGHNTGPIHDSVVRASQAVVRGIKAIPAFKNRKPSSRGATVRLRLEQGSRALEPSFEAVALRPPRGEAGG